MSGAAADHAAQFLREFDRDRYLATLVLPEKHRSAIQALYAFSADVAAIRERVRGPAAGEIRLQWWVDALEGKAHGEVRQNPLAAALFEAIESYALPAGPLRRLLAARRFDLYDDPMPDLDSFEGYAGETSSVLYQLAAMILNGGAEIGNGDAAGHFGVAHAMIGHLRAFGFNASRSRIFLPWNILAANGVMEAEVFTGAVSEGLLAGLGQIAELALAHLQQAETALLNLPRHLRPAFAGTALLRPELARVQAGAGAPFVPPQPLPDWRKIAAVVWWAWRHG